MGTVTVVVAIVVVDVVVVIIGNRNSGGSSNGGGGEVVLLTVRLGVGGHWSRSLLVCLALFSPVFLYFSEAERGGKEGGHESRLCVRVYECEFW